MSTTVSLMTDAEQAARIETTTAPRVTKEQIARALGTLVFHKHRFPDTTATVVLAQLPSGFTVGIGFSACVDPSNFREDIGFDIATKNAINEAEKRLWELEGYVLSKHLSTNGQKYTNAAIARVDSKFNEEEARFYVVIHLRDGNVAKGSAVTTGSGTDHDVVSGAIQNALYHANRGEFVTTVKEPE